MGDKRTLSPSVVKIVDGVSGLSLVEASELLKALEEHLGVTIASRAPLTAVVNPGPPFRGFVNPPEYSLWVEAPGPNRKQMVMLLRERLRMTLAEAVALADRLPGLVLENTDMLTAEEWLAELRRLGIAAKKIGLD